MNLNLFIECKT